jgi:hypothetical protein
MTTPVAIAKAIDDDRFIWVWDKADNNSLSCISKIAPDSTEGCRPLQALVSHLVLSEWEELD